MLTPGTGQINLVDNANRGIFFRLATDEPLRVWTGRPKIRITNDLDGGPAVYSGIGSVDGLPELDRLLNGEARRITVKLSGLNPRAVEIIDSEFTDLSVAGVQARFGHLAFDRLWQPTSTVRWVWDGVLDEVSIEARTEQEGQLWTVDLSMATAMTDGKRPENRFWTPKSALPGDLGFDFVPLLSEGTTRKWPPG